MVAWTRTNVGNGRLSHACPTQAHARNFQRKNKGVARRSKEFVQVGRLELTVGSSWPVSRLRVSATPGIKAAQKAMIAIDTRA